MDFVLTFPAEAGAGPWSWAITAFSPDRTDASRYTKHSDLPEPGPVDRSTCGGRVLPADRRYTLPGWSFRMVKKGSVVSEHLRITPTD